MKYLALFLAYVAIMMNVSHYYQLQDQSVDLSFWKTFLYILSPLVAIFITICLGIVIVAVGMYYKWWTKPKSPNI